MGTLINYFSKIKWGVASFLLGVVAPGLYQMLIYNQEFVRSESIDKIFFYAVVVPSWTYAVLVGEAVLLIVVYRFFKVMIEGHSSGKKVISYAVLAGYLNLIVVWPGNKFDVYTDDTRKYLFVLIENWEWIVAPLITLGVLILLLIVKRFIEKKFSE